METGLPQDGLWGIAILNAAIFILLAFSFFKPPPDQASPTFAHISIQIYEVPSWPDRFPGVGSRGRTMGRLDIEERTAMAVLLERGHSQSAVARLLGVSEGAVRYHRKRWSADAADGRSRQASGISTACRRPAARPRLIAQDGVVGEPADDHSVLGQRGNFLCRTRLFGAAIVHHGRAGAGWGVRTRRRAGGQEDRRGCEGGGWPRPASGGGWHRCAPACRAARRRGQRARPHGGG